MFANEIRRKRVEAMRQHTHWPWHLDEVYVKINGEMHYLWRAVDHEGEVLESFVTKERDKAAALKFIKKAMKRHGCPKTIVTDGLRSYGAALKELGGTERQEMSRWLNNRAENSHQPFRRRERAMLRFRRMKTLQAFASVHGTVHNHFNQERHLVSREIYKKRRDAALAAWRGRGVSPGWVWVSLALPETSSLWTDSTFRGAGTRPCAARAPWRSAVPFGAPQGRTAATGRLDAGL